MSEQVGNVRTLLEVLCWRAAHQRERIAYRFLADEALPVARCSTTTWTYGELYQRVQAIATELTRHDGLVGQPVLLVYQPGLELIAAFLGCLSAGAIATLVPPPRRHESLARWQHIMTDANVAGVLTTQSLLSDITLLARPRSFDSIHWIATDTVEHSNVSSHRNRAPLDLPSPETIAFLQYTSGSTSQPKGVIVTHANIAHNLQQIQTAFAHSEGTECVIWLPPYHDMGLIGGILQPLYGGYPVTLMSPSSFLRQPLRWLEAISHFGKAASGGTTSGGTTSGGTTSGGPNFAYDYCARKISAEQCQSLDLSTWSLAFTGAEPIRAQTLARFSEKFAGCGFQRKAFYPCYGLAESTLFVTGKEAIASPNLISVESSQLNQGKVQRVGQTADSGTQQPNTQRPNTQQPNTQQVVSCGHARAQQIEIVNPKTGSPCDSGAVGEIWIAGESVAAGYWNQVTATKETFNNTLKGRRENFLRTGDLGFIYSGELFVTGRLKDLIVIRGQNYYPQDIELSVGQAHASLQSAAAFSLAAEGAQAENEQLVIVQELSRTAVRQIRKKTLQVTEVFEAIRAGVSGQHGLRVEAIALLKPGHLPKTTSGKVQRQSCKQQFLAGTLETVAQWNYKSQQGPTSEAAASRTVEKPDRQVAQATEALLKTEALLAWLQDYAKTSINSRVMDERRCLSPNIVLDFGNQGLLGMQVPQQYGGLELNNSSTLQIIEQLGAIDTTLALFVGLNNVLGIRPILHYAQPGLKAELLPRLAAGRELAAFALTESGAGSHPLGIAAKATPTTTDRWQLTGEKIWSGSAAWAGVTNVFVQEVDAAGIPVGISGFAVKKGTPGLRQGPEALTMGMRGMVQNTVLLEGALVSDAERLGEAGKGMAVAQDAMMYGRLAIASACVGGMKRCAQLMLRYSKRRMVSTGRLLDNPVMMTRLNWVAGAIAATESLVTLTATRLDANLPVPEEIYAACKIVAPEFYWQAADNLVQCLGGRGYIETNLAPQILRDARVLRIFEGPTESLAMYLGSRVVNQPETLKSFFETLHISNTSSLLFESAGWIVSHYLSEKSAFPDRLTALRQAHFVVGKIAAWAILLAALEATAAPISAVIWCQKTLEKAVKQAMEIQPDESANGNSTVESIERYQQSIGELEQTLAGADEAVDNLLKLDQPPLTTLPTELSAKQNSPSSATQAYMESHGQSHGQAYPYGQTRKRSSSSPSSGKRTKAIESWLVQWLSGQLKVEADTIDVNKAFADYGLDSVMAVELAQELGTFFNLSEPLEVTLAWNFPTIQSLANHLAIMLAQQEMTLSNSPDSEEKAPTENSNTLNNFSEAEAADALAAELMAMRGQ